MRKKRICSLLLAAVMLTGTALQQGNPAPVRVSAADGRLYNQWDEKWKDVTFTKYSRAGNSLYTSACGIFSFCNAIYGLNSRKIDVVELATWAVEIGALRPGAGGTYRDILYKHIEEKWGKEYGFTLGTQKIGTVRDEEFIEHLKKGGVAVLYVPGHFIAVTGYDEGSQNYHVIESAVSQKRGLDPDSWVSADKLTDGGTNGTWYVLISNIKAPEYAKVSLPRTLWGVDEMMTYTLDSNTRNDYALHFYENNAESPIAELSVAQHALSSTQHMTCSISYAGDYTVDISGGNEFGKVTSDRIGVRIYDQKISDASFSAVTKDYEVGKPVRFRTAGSPAAGYTLNITDAAGESVCKKEIADMLDGITLKESEAEWVPDYPGKYTCSATLSNVFGNVTPKPVEITVAGDVPFTLNAAGGELSEPAEYKLPYAGKYGSLPVPVRDNHRFDGWFTAADGGEQVTADTVITQTHPHTLYANWTKVLDHGDINGDHSIDTADAQLTLAEYVNMLSGQSAAFDAAQNKSGDINGDGAIGIEDAQFILKYYVQNAVAGKAVTWDELTFVPAVTTTTVTTTTTTVTTTTTTAKTTTSTTKANTTATKATTAATKATTTATKATTAATKATTAATKATASATKATTAATKATTAAAKTTASATKATTAATKTTTGSTALTTVLSHQTVLTTTA